MKTSENNQKIVDFAVIGGGPAGMLASLALARAGYRVAIFAPRGKGDNRTSALMMPSIHMLENLGLWKRLEPYCAGLEVMRLVDGTERLLRGPTLNFDARQIQDDPFGWNVPNELLIDEIRKELEEITTVQVFESAVSSVAPSGDDIHIISEGREIIARYAVAADGRQSATREATGIKTKWWEHPQTALTAVLDHPRPHGGVSTEFHRPDGPFTLVPMPGNRSSLVWVEAPAEAERILALTQEAQEDLIFRISQGLLGKPALVSGPYAFPLKSMRVSAHAAQRVFLIGETGHVFPPIGAQGLNLTMRDIASLVDILPAPHHLAAASTGLLEREFNAARRTDTWLRTYGVNLLNYSLLLPFLPVQLARVAGLGALSALRPVRERAMRMGMAPGRVPSLMQRTGA